MWSLIAATGSSMKYFLEIYGLVTFYNKYIGCNIPAQISGRPRQCTLPPAALAAVSPRLGHPRPALCFQGKADAGHLTLTERGFWWLWPFLPYIYDRRCKVRKTRNVEPLIPLAVFRFPHSRDMFKRVPQKANLLALNLFILNL